MKKEQKEKIAISAANTWCRCFKCDGKVNATGYTCNQDKKLTCHKWYDGYRTAMLALSEYEQQLTANAVDAMIGLPYVNKDLGYTHIVDVLRPLPVGHNIIAIIFKED